MKIMIATGIYPPDIGGPATYSKLLFDELPKRGFEVRALSFGEVRHWPKIIRHFVYFFKVLKAGTKADVVFAQDPVSVGLPACLASFFLRKKFVLKIVGDYAWEQFQNNKSQKFITPEEFQNNKYDFLTELRRKIERRVAKRAEKIIVPSKYLKKIVLMWGVPENKIKVVYNSFDASGVDISKEQARKDSGLSGFILISAGRSVPWKGFGALKDLMPEVQKEILEAKLIIVEQAPHKKVLEYLRAGDLFVLNTGYEGLSHQILEAMAIGIPVVTTDIGGNPEIIENNKSGILVEYNNKEQLKKAIIALYKNKELRDKIVKNAKEKIKEFSKEKMINETIKALS